MKKRPGVYIEHGPQNFEIIQRNGNNCADIALSGSWVGQEEAASQEVYVRLMMENSNREVVSYTKCRTEGDRWSILLKDIPAGGLYKIETGLCLDHNLQLDWNTAGEMRHFIGVGDVYVIAGQSNSTGYGKGVIEDEPAIGVHALEYDGGWRLASQPLGDCTNAVFQDSLEGANHGNSPYLRFAKILQKELHIPIGLVPTALGGSPMKSWNPHQDGILYRNMLNITARLTNGYCCVLWYQGCTDTDLPEDTDAYGTHFREMVAAWRQDSHCPGLRFLTFQLNRCRSSCDPDLDRRWGVLRETQRQAARNIENCFIVPTSDIPLSDSIHNSAGGNLLLGERAARLALWEMYHKGLPYSAASLKRAYVRSKSTLGLEFDGLVGLLDGFTDDMDKLDIVVEDRMGRNRIRACHFGPEENYLELEREIGPDCVISCGAGRDVEKVIPIDHATFMPILCFGNVKVDV